MNKFKISCSINTTGPDADLELAILIDGVTVFQQIIRDKIIFTHEMPDISDNPEMPGAVSEHKIQFVMSGKLPKHTVVTSTGQIIADAYLIIKDITIDEVEIDSIVNQKAVYSHNFNDQGPETQDKFYNTMGCNGTVTMNFTTPVYLWLLENM